MADDIVKEALERFRKAEEAENHNRVTFKADVEFSRLDKQWPYEIEQARKNEVPPRPCLTQNKLLPVIRQVVNDARMNRPATSVHPVDGGADKETAEVLTGLIRQIEASSDADVAYDTAVENAVSGGFGYWRINTDYALHALDEDGIKSAGEGAFDQNLYIRPIANSLSVYGDPMSTAADSGDWNEAFVVDLMDKDTMAATYPGASNTSFSGHEWNDVQAPWIDGDTVQVAEFWQRDRVTKNAYAVQMDSGDVVVMFEEEIKANQALFAELGAQVIGQPRPVLTHKVKQYIINGIEVLKETDWAGAYIPIVPVYGDEVNLLGKRYFRSLISGAKDAQRMFNYWDTTLTEMIALAPRVPYIGEQGSFDVDKEKWATANSHSHSYLEYKKGSPLPQRNDISMVPAGMLQMSLTASDNIKAITGIYDASLGARSNETSGVAIRSRQMEGDVATFHFIDNLSRAIRHSGRILIDLIPKVYSTPRMVRILGQDDSTDEKPINQEFEDKDGTLRIHDVRTGRYDVTVKAGPSFTTRREEAAAQMIELIRAYPDAAPVIGDLLAKNLDWPGSDEIAKRLERTLPPHLKDDEGNIPPEVQQQMQQMAQAIQQLQAQLGEAEDDKVVKLMGEGTKRYDAETKRLQATQGMMTPEMVQQIVIQVMNDLFTPDLPQTGTAPGM